MSREEFDDFVSPQPDGNIEIPVVFVPTDDVANSRSSLKDNHVYVLDRLDYSDPDQYVKTLFLR